MTGRVATAEELAFDFDAPFASWSSADDGVMGGRSRSQFTAIPCGGRFTGVVSLANGGGFCSVRSPDFAEGWAGFDAVSLLVRGDGRTFTFCLHTRGLMPGMSYRRRFTPQAGEWAEITLPLEEFVLMRFGFRVGVAPVNPDHIRAVSLMVADAQEGPFTLDVKRIALRGG